MIYHIGMANRSRNIGKEQNGLRILGTSRTKNDTNYLVQCTQCGKRFTIGRRTLQRGITGCPDCKPKKTISHNTTGGNPKLVRIYYSILKRTMYSANDRQHRKTYMDRGIKMCDEWLNDYTKFEEWALANGYEEGLTIDRIDNSKGYSPQNCRWLTLKQQANNRTTNVTYQFRGRQMTLSEIADIVGIRYSCLYQRINTQHMTLREALNVRYDRRKAKNRVRTTDKAESVQEQPKEQ